MPTPSIPPDPASLQTWLPPVPEDWRLRLKSAADLRALRSLSLYRLDFLAVAKLDRALASASKTTSDSSGFHTTRLALLASSTTHHLLPSLRVAALRRGVLLDIYECGYGQYVQEATAPSAALRAFDPQAVLFALDAHHILDLHNSGVEVVAHLQSLWNSARTHLGATVLQQTVLPVFPALLGSNEHRIQSPATAVAHINHQLRTAADEAGVHLVSVDHAAAIDGLHTWHDPAMWFRAKQEIHPAAAPLFGELAAPVLAALAGRSAKCLVLDLDNTLWGGVIGDDGIEGIHLGQGHAAGEAFLGFQRYCLQLRERGILLAICSKNTESIALAALRDHPAMLLRPEYFAATAINWNDKATNLRSIAAQLNIGTDALVFADDNPFERELVRRELPEVAVPELPEEPARYASTIARGGYFESLGLTAEDSQRADQYRANAARETHRAAATDLDSYLRSLRMTLHARPFDRANLARIVQLIGKTNQFNLTTRRYGTEEVEALMADPAAVTLQASLTDSFGDNGTIALAIGRVEDTTLRIDTWLMSCRVLGRRVEDATLSLMAEAARKRGLSRILGEYRPTPKNGIVADLYPRLGFSLVAAEDEVQLFALSLESYNAPGLPITVESAAL